MPFPSIEELIAQLEARKRAIQAGGGPERVQKQHEAGKLTARERVAKLFDPETFTELDMFVEHRCTSLEMDKTVAPADGVVTGFGHVNGRLVYAFAQDFTVIGGSLGEMHAKKITKLQDLAMRTGAPLVGINDSGGARIQEGVDSLSGYGEIFFRNTLASGVIPQISVLVGPSAGGAVYSPALTDFVFMAKGIAKMFITGPDVIKAAIGEEISAEELGGAMTHNQLSGNAHFACDTEEELVPNARQNVSRNLHHRHEGEALRGAPAGGEGDEIASRSGEPREDLGLPPGRVHHNESPDLRRLAVLIDRLDRSGARLGDGAKRLLLDGSQATLDVAAGRLAAPHVAPHGFGPAFHAVDESQDALRHIGRSGVPRQDVLGPDELGDLAQDRRTARRHHHVGSDPDRRRREKPLRRVRGAALEAEDQLRDGVEGRLDHGRRRHQLLRQEVASRHGARLAALLLNHQAFDPLPGRADLLRHLLERDPLASETDQ